MNLTSYAIEQALKQLQLPESTVTQFNIASSLSDVGGSGFPKELFQLSAPVVVRGLLNYAILQMNRDWVYPYWVHRQLDYKGISFVPRSQNPLLINITHRNWTAIGTPDGFHEAIVDPRGLVTPLPREWSVDIWLECGGKLFFPSQSDSAAQYLDANAPAIATVIDANGVELKIEHFVGSTNRGVDVLFQRAAVKNTSAARIEGTLIVALRPFNPEGVAPIRSIEFRHRRFAYIDKVLGVAFAKAPDWVHTSNARNGDTANTLRTHPTADRSEYAGSTSCPDGLANAIAGFTFALEPQHQHFVDCSVALDTEKVLRKREIKQSWRVSFEKRKEQHISRWKEDLATAADFEFADDELQKVFEASRSTLLQFNDNEFISPGPFLYHRFWYRDAAPMVRGLDLLGFSQRARTVIDAFPKKLTPEGFFKGPEGEWDSNGAVLWSVYKHYQLVHSDSWLRSWYPNLSRAAAWIVHMIRKSNSNAKQVPGVMPASLSAEHLGTVDQYYWDSFWSLAGLRAIAEAARVLEKDKDATHWQQHFQQLNSALHDVIRSRANRTQQPVIPSSPNRSFDESAIGSICCVYPLEVLKDIAHPSNTVYELCNRFTNEHGFFHPIIHSGYNPYLTLQLAHSLLWLNDIHHAWRMAETIFNQCKSPYSLPEAIHPSTGGGSMGDGHHGWAAAEIVLFLRDCLLREEGKTLILFGGANKRLIDRGKQTRLTNVPTSFGIVNVRLDFESAHRCIVEFQNQFLPECRPETLGVHLPFRVSKVTASSPGHILFCDSRELSTRVSCSSSIRTLFVDL